MKKRILMIDNDPYFLLTRREPLERAGYEVLTVETLEEARAILRTRNIHLATIDVRMDDDDSHTDKSGLSLAKDPEFAHILKIVLTGYHFEHKDINNILMTRPNPHELPDAFAYISKHDDPDTNEKGVDVMLRFVDEALTHYSGINWSLAFEWPSPNFAGDLAAWLGGAPRVEWQERGEELTNLLAMAFHNCERIRIDRLLWRTGPRLALAVTAWRDKTIVDRIAVITRRPDDDPTASGASDAPGGAAARAPSERAPDGHAQLVRPLRPARTLHYTADLYELPGGRLDQVRSLRQFYADSRPAALGDCVDRLLANGLAPWNELCLLSETTHADTLLRRHAGLGDDAAGRLAHALRHVGQVAAQAGVGTLSAQEDGMLFRSLHRPDRQLPNPAAWLAQPGPARFRKPMALGTGFRCPPPDTILVAPDGHAWLTDLGDAGDGPLLSVFADLETMFVHEVHAFQNPIEFVDAMEKLLFSADLTHHLEPPSVELKKLFAAVQKIRRRAENYGKGTTYFRLLFYHTARRLSAMLPLDSGRDHAVMPAVCACLGLGLLAQRLEEIHQARAAAAPRRPGLYIDEPSRRCFLDDKPVRLAPTLYRFLLYLWHHPRQHCDNEKILRFATESTSQWATNYAPHLVRQIRRALGPSAERYLVTSKGGGYILFPDGKPDEMI